MWFEYTIHMRSFCAMFASQIVLKMKRYTSFPCINVFICFVLYCQIQAPDCHKIWLPHITVYHIIDTDFRVTTLCHSYLQFYFDIENNSMQPVIYLHEMFTPNMIFFSVHNLLAKLGLTLVLLFHFNAFWAFYAHVLYVCIYICITYNTL